MPKRVKYYAGVLKEKSGEHENYYDYIAEAKSISQARGILNRCARTFFEDGSPQRYDGGWDFYGGETWVGVHRVERTTKTAWLQRQFELWHLR